MGLLKDLEREIGRGVGGLTQGIAGIADPIGNLFSRGQLRSTESLNKDAKEKANAAAKGKQKGLLKLLKDDETISEATREELSAITRSGPSFNAPGAAGIYEKNIASVKAQLKDAQLAKEGSIYASRQGTEELLKIIKDQPGRGQFVSSGRSKNSSL